MSDVHNIRETDDDARDPPLEEVVARLTRAVDRAHRAGRGDDVGDMLPALNRLIELLEIAPSFRADKTRRLVEIERQMTRAGRGRGEIAAVIRERLGMSKPTYHREREKAVAAGALPSLKK